MGEEGTSSNIVVVSGKQVVVEKLLSCWLSELWGCLVQDLQVAEFCRPCGSSKLWACD